ncbi:MAG: PQQ-binding-like beta-propeller repeat protein, partial [Planctomycetaceae bacterium]|nr:PQQ-binding-like beta-propeller repeat protein [Planctomycetaceae bacterium]
MRRQLLRAFTFVVLTSPLLLSADWTAFRGPDGNGKSPDTGLLQQWAPEGPKLLWTADFVGYGYSSVAIADNKIYITGNAEREGQTLSMLFCLDKDGNKIWEKNNGPAHTDVNKYPSTRGTPSIVDGFVYDISALGEIACFHAQTGEKIWSRNIVKEYELERLPWWLYGNAVLVDGDAVISPLGGPKHIAIALHKKTGEPLWASPPVANPAGATASYTTPYAFDFEGIRVVIVMSEVTVEGVDAKTGKALFSIPWRNDRTTNCTMPIYREGCLFISTGYNFGAKMFRLAKNADGTITPNEVWFEQQFENQHGGLLLIGDYVYGSTHQRQMWGAINFATGEMGYLTRVRGIGQGSAAYADGLIYALSEDNKTVLLIKPEPTEFIEISRFELPNEAEGKSWAHPVVLGGRLYIRHGQYLYCYDVKMDSPNDPQPADETSAIQHSTALLERAWERRDFAEIISRGKDLLRVSQAQNVPENYDAMRFI